MRVLNPLHLALCALTPWYRMPPSKLFEALHARDAKRVKHLVSKEGCDVNETGAVRSLTPPLPSR